VSTLGDPVAATACWTAAARAGESIRSDRLFDDPWAEALAGPEGRAWLEGRSPTSLLPIVIRTRYFDDWLTTVAAEHPLDQVVIVGAGLDTRAYRLAWPSGVVVYEIDRAALLARKAHLLEGHEARPRCERREVAADLVSDWPVALAAAGFSQDRPTAWLLEGLLFYLPPDLLRRVLTAVSTLSAVGSRLGFDIVNASVLTNDWTRPWVEMQAAAGAPWVGTMEDPRAELAHLGWTASLSQAGQPDADYGRWSLPVLPTAMPRVPHHWFVTAERVATPKGSLDVDPDKDLGG
jgi:methyltransferase (TIGR00027 family)